MFQSTRSRIHLGWALVCIVSLSPAIVQRLRACDPNPDPHGLAGPHVLFINNCTDGTSIVASNAHTREQAMNPYTPLRDPFGLRISDTNSKLVGATATDPVGDTVYIRGGTYEMPLINVYNRVVFWQENNIKIKAYPGERVTIRGSSFLPGGVPPNTHCNPIPGQGICVLSHMFQFWFCKDSVVEGIEFVGNTQATILINGQNVTGLLSNPYVLRFWGCDRLTLRDIGINDFASILDIGLGHRYTLDPSYAHTEHMERGLTVSYSTGLEMDRVRVQCSADNPGVINQTAIPWNIVGFITESIIGTAESPIRIHDCSFGACAGNAVELSTVVQPQINVLFDHNVIDNWKNGVQIGGSGLSQGVVLRENQITYNHYSLSAWGMNGYGIKCGNSDGLKLVNNVIYEGGLEGPGILIEGGIDPTGQFRTSINSDILHNTLYRAGSQAISISNVPNPDGTIPATGITGTRVLNNLINQVNTSSAQSTNLNNRKRELYLQFRQFEENGAYGNVFHNNLFVPARSDGKAVGTADFGFWQLHGGLTGAWQCYVDAGLPGCNWVSCSPFQSCDMPTRYKYTGNSFNLLGPIAQGNINAVVSDPMFVNAASADFRLVSGSPAINNALPLAEVPTDINGVPRSLGGGVCIGAYEFDPVLMGDMNCDYQITAADINAMILAMINPTGYSLIHNCLQSGDFNQDSLVNGRDIRGFADLLTP